VELQIPTVFSTQVKWLGGRSHFFRLNLRKQKRRLKMAKVPAHCSICNKLFSTEPDQKILHCIHCGSPYAHYADCTCKSLTFNEWKNNDTLSDIAESIPDASGNSTDPDRFITYEEFVAREFEKLT